ncbi:MAG: hypothetical protein FJ278_04680, partial [Planctomycetes bacterium]|nr:hypothetical protein [Planctomycetota bacterium]
MKTLLPPFAFCGLLFLTFLSPLILAQALRNRESPTQNAAIGKPMENHRFSASEMRDGWILDGEAELTVAGEGELKVTATKQMALWCPKVFEGRVTVEFDCLVPEPKTKLLLLVHGHGTDGTPIREWTRDGTYDEYNARRMEVYSIAFNRGSHISDNLGDQMANVRRIGGKDFAPYTSESFRQKGQAFWNEWNTRSLVGACLEPARGTGKHLRYRVTLDPPRILLEVEGAPFGELVDHRPNPLTKGSVGFRCMT